jgi:hypothetical protein
MPGVKGAHRRDESDGLARFPPFRGGFSQIPNGADNFDGFGHG